MTSTAAMPPTSETPRSLYIHVPFCRAKCRYCAFHSQPLTQDSLALYLRTLHQEIRLWAGRLTPDHKRLTLDTVFLGGGTPSLLPPSELTALFHTLRQHFSLAPGAEISCEANPESASAEFLSAALDAGVTRLSLGVQSFDPGDLARLGRIHTVQDALQAFALARELGFANIGLDLIWGLPGQTPAAWRTTLAQAIALGPEHLSCYGLSLDPGSALAGQDPDTLNLPCEEDAERMYLDTAAQLNAAGYAQDEISNFSRPGLACRHNQACWEGRDYLGLGPAAVSTLTSAAPGTAGARRHANAKDLDAHCAAVAAGRPDADAEDLCAEIRAQERLMLALRTAKGLDLAQYRHQFQIDLLARHAALLDALAQQNLARLENGRLLLSIQGMLVSNSIIAALME